MLQQVALVIILLVSPVLGPLASMHGPVRDSLNAPSQPQASGSSVILHIDPAKLAPVRPGATSLPSALDRAAAQVLSISGSLRVEPLFPGAPAPQIWHARNRSRFPQRMGRSPRGQPLPDLREWYRVELDLGVDAQVAARAMQGLPAVTWAQPVVDPTPTGLPDDPLFSSQGAWGQGYGDQWALARVGLGLVGTGRAWDFATGSRDVVVAVYGTGLDYNHPDLGPNLWINPGENLDGDQEIWDVDDLNGLDDDGNGLVDDVHGWNFRDRNRDVMDSGKYAGHDTSVASIVGAVGNNGQGMTGVNWQVSLLPFNDIYAGWVYVVDQGADVIVLSYDFGGSAALAPQLAYAEANGVLVVSSAGNDGAQLTDRWPQGPGTMIVGAVDAADQVPAWSARGERLDVVAPGVGVMTATPLAFANFGFARNRTPFSVAQDGQSVLHLVTYDPARRTLWYRTRTDGLWAEPRAVAGITGDIGRHHDIALDTGGTPWIVFYDITSQAIRLAHLVGGSWHVETVAQEELNLKLEGRQLALLLDGAGRPGVAYQRKSNRGLIFRWRDGSTWREENVYSLGSGLQHGLARAVDHNGQPALLFGTNPVLLARRTAGGWQVEPVAQDGAYGSLAFDTVGEPHVLYGQASLLIHAWRDGEGWQSETAASEANEVRWTSLIFDDSGRPLAGYGIFDGQPYFEHYDAAHVAFRLDGTWYQEEVTATDSPGYFVNLVLANGLPELFHLGWRDGRLRVAGRDQGLPAVGSGPPPVAGWQDVTLVDLGYPYGPLSGTSAAAPLVAGQAALLLSAHPQWTLGQLRWAISRSAHDVGPTGFDPDSGFGVIDVTAALASQPPVDDRPPTSLIRLPYPGQIFASGEEIPVLGTASDDNFHHYSLWVYRTTSKPVVLYQRSQRFDQLLGTIGGLEPGVYEIRLEAWDWEGKSLSTVTIGVDEVPPSEPGTLAGMVFIDSDGNGMRGSGEEGLPEVLITVTDSAGALVSQLLSLDSGAWQVDNVPPGVYYVQGEAAYGWYRTTVDLETVILPSGSTVSDIDIGFVSSTALAVAGLSAQRVGGSNRLTWNVLDQLAVDSFLLWRAERVDGLYKRLWLTPMPVQPGRIQYAVYDNQLLPSRTYWYQLQVFPSGEWLGPVGDGFVRRLSFLPLLLHR